MKDKQVLVKNYVPFADCINKTDNRQVDNTKDVEVVTLICNLIEYRKNYSKTLGCLWQYYRDMSNATVTGSESIIFEPSIREKIPDADNKKDDEIAVPL